MSGDQLIELDRVSVELGGRRILTDVSVELSARRIGVVGSNGSGKSTFARVLDGLVRPTSGHARVHGIDTVKDVGALRRRVGFVFTNPDAQILMPTPAEDVALSLRGSGRSRARVAEAVRAALDRYGLAGHADAPAYSLSGGQKQLLALAAVLVSEPRLVVADEPTTLLDLANSRRVRRLLLDEIDAQVVVVTHDLELARACDVVLRFEEGRLVDHGDPRRVVDDYEREAA